MGLFERMGLVERDEAPVMPEFIPEYVPDPSVEANVQSTENIVGGIYDANGFSDRPNSILTVQALIDTLPSEMTTQKKQVTVAGNLKVFGKNVSDLVADADERLDLLRSALSKVVAERTEEIRVANERIEQLKQEIEDATLAIKNAEDIIDCTRDSVEDEVKHVSDLRDFCVGMESA